MKLIVVLVLALAAFVLAQEADLASLAAPRSLLFEDPQDAPLYTANVTLQAEMAAMGWTLYKQCNSAWGSQRLGTCSLTICQAGCAMSDVAMMLTTKGVKLNPGQLNAWLDKNGGYAAGCNIVWASVDKFGKTKFQGIERASEAAICAGLKKGHGIIANVNGGRHWVLLTGCAGNGVFYVNDPGFERSTYKMSEIIQEAVYH